MPKQTAVEWLVEQIKDYNSSNDDNYIRISSWNFNRWIEDSKDQHKEEIIEAYRESMLNGQNGLKWYDKGAISYFKETYKGGEE